MTPTRRHAVVALAVAVAVAGCSTGSGTHPSAAAGPTIAAATPASSSASPTEPTTTTTVVGYPAVSASGSLLRPPATPVTIPAQDDCHRLLTQPAATATISACATATGPTGTVTGTEEGYAHTQQWNVWKRIGNNADLVLTYTGNFQSTPGFVFHSADPANDADPKLLAIEHIPGTESVRALDIIEASGAVVAHITVAVTGGVVGPSPNGGIETWTATAANTATAIATATVIRYTNGAWRTMSASSVLASQVPVYPNDDGFGPGLP